MLKILRTCGNVVSWKPMHDCENSKTNGFGFVDFDSPHAVCRAIRFLDGLEVDGSHLIVKINKATQEFLDAFFEDKHSQKTLSEAISVEGNKEHCSKITTNQKSCETNLHKEISDLINERCIS